MNPVQRWVVPSISMLLFGLVGCPASGPDPVPVPVWHDGDAFRLELELSRPAHVVVVHVDARGDVALVHPESVADPVPRVGPGTVRVPPVDAGYDWVFEGEPGWESFIVGRSVSVPDLGELLRRLREAPDPGLPTLASDDSTGPGAGARERRVAALTTTMREHLGHADAIEVLHLP